MRTIERIPEAFVVTCLPVERGDKMDGVELNPGQTRFEVDEATCIAALKTRCFQDVSTFGEIKPQFVPNIEVAIEQPLVPTTDPLPPLESVIGQEDNDA